jgi:hypothetical protein
MSIESFSPLPLNIFSTWVTLLDPSDVPAGMSPSLGDVEFFPGGVRTRAGLATQFSPVAAAPQINGVKTYATTNLVQRFLALDSLGNIYKETSPGALTLAVSGVALTNCVNGFEYGTTPDAGKTLVKIGVAPNPTPASGNTATSVSVQFTQGPPYGAVVYYARTSGLDGNGNAVFSTPALASSVQITPAAPSTLTVTVK